MTTKISGLLNAIPLKDGGFGTISQSVEDALEHIDQEVSKRGTLHSDSIDVEKLKSAASEILVQAAHLNAYRGLAIGISIESGDDRLASLLAISEHLFKKAWPDLHPQGASAKRLRKAWATEIVSLLSDAAMAEANSSDGLPLNIAKRLTRLEKLLTELKLDVKPLSNIATAPQFASAVANAKDEPTQALPAGVAGSASKVSAKVVLDAGGRARLRENIRNLAQTISEYDPDSAVGYHMRAYAAWMETPLGPVHDSDKVLEQPGLSKSLREEFLRLAETPSLTNVLKFEDRLYHSPDWFEGHWTVSRMLKSLGLKNASLAVQDRCVARLRALPILLDLYLPNKETLVPNNVRQWLQVGTASLPGELQLTDGETENLDVSIAMFDGALENANSTREAALAKISFARQAASENCQSVSNLLLDEVYREMTSMQADQWDAHMFAQIVSLRDA